MLEPIRARHELPALAAAAMQRTELLASGAVGVRALGHPEAVTVEDQWHIGSCTKSMTATLAAMFVQRGQLEWTSTVGESFPDLRESMDPQWQGVALEQLLQHRGGAPEKPPANLWRNASLRRGTIAEQRSEFVRGLLLRRPEAEPGTKTIYSNQGYAIAGLMLEQAGGEIWERLMEKMLFPVGLMSGAGFGAPGSTASLNQPWGHLREDGMLVPIPPGPKADNPPAIGPAGTVHCTITELARYAAWHARGEKMGAPALKREGFVKLHTPPPESEHAMGWIVQQRDWAGGVALTHTGSNTMWYAVMWIAPGKEAAFVAATNCAGDTAARACDEAVAAMIGRYLK